MRDPRLRDLERRFRETGSLEAEVAWLTERLRVGELERDLLLTASAVGHAASEALVGVQHNPLQDLPFDDGPGYAYNWSLGLEVTQRCLAATLSSEPWLTAAGTEALAEAVGLLERRVLWPDRTGDRLRRLEGDLLAAAEAAADTLSLADALRPVLNSLARRWDSTSYSIDSQASVVSSLSELATGRSLPFEAITTEVSAWLLGEADPLRDRVERREARSL
ncbi:MAG: hypothetical protein JKY65_17995 [Planctomycetes bacterium]|nr:hypothetical protein [Planctomycetota bacterium]